MAREGTPLTYTMLAGLPQEPFTLTAALHHLPCLSKFKGDLVYLSLVPLSFHRDGTLIKKVQVFLLQCAHYNGETFKVFLLVIFSKNNVKTTVAFYFSHL